MLLHINSSLSDNNIKVKQHIITVTVGSEYVDAYRGYIGSVQIPSLESIGVSGTLLVDPIISSYGNTYDANIDTCVKISTKREDLLYVSTARASSTVEIKLVYIYKWLHLMNQ